MNLKFTTQSPELTWDSVTKTQLHTLLIDQFGAKEPDIASLLTHFSTDRPKKSPETSVRNFYYKWYEQLPLCLKPSNDEERKKCIDLLHRTLFYHALDDPYLQKDISNLAEGAQTLKTFLW